MNKESFDTEQADVADDPMVTAFALGEVGDHEAVRLRDAAARDPRLNATVEAIRRQADELRSALARRADEPGLSEDRQEFVLATARKVSWRMKSVAQEPRPLSARLRMSERELALFWSGLGAAAAVVVMLVWQVSIGDRQVRPVADGSPDILSGDLESVDSAVLRIEFLEDGTAASAQPDPMIRRLPSNLASTGSDGWLPVAGALASAGSVEPGGIGVRPSAAFPLWVDDASFHAAHRALVRERRLPDSGEVKVEQWIAAVHRQPGDDGATVFEPGIGRVGLQVTPEIRMAAEVATAPWQAGHELVMLEVVLEGAALEQFRRGAQVVVEPNPATVDAFRMIGFNTVSSAAGGGAVGDGQRVDASGEMLEPDAYVMTALAEVRRAAGAGGSDLLRFKLEPVRGVGGGFQVPVLAVPALAGGGPEWRLASHDFQAAAAAAELGLMLGGELDVTGYARLSALGDSGGVLDGSPARRDLNGMIRAAAALQGAEEL